MAFFTGTEGRITAGGNNVNVTGWSFDSSQDDLDTTHTGTGGFEDGIDTYKRASGSIDFNFDSAANPHAPTPGIKVGALLALKLYLKNSSGPYYDIPVAKVTGFTVNSKVGSVVNCSAKWKARGTFTEPVTNF